MGVTERASFTQEGDAGSERAPDGTRLPCDRFTLRCPHTGHGIIVSQLALEEAAVDLKPVLLRLALGVIRNHKGHWCPELADLAQHYNLTPLAIDGISVTGIW